MSDPSLDQRVRSFFDAFADASDRLDLEALGRLFADPFLAADPAGVRPVPRELFLQALPRRAELFGAAGIGRVVLTDERHEALDDTYVLARTGWRGERTGGDGSLPPVRLASTFLLRRDGDDLRVVLYLNHHDLARVLSSA